MIRFNKVPYTGEEFEHIRAAIASCKLSGDGGYTARCNAWLEENTGTTKALLTTSCTSALEMSALLADIGAGDEVIMPSYTFVSSANAFAIRGAVPVFVDIRPDTMNIDERLIEDAITEHTKALCVVHYAGVACEMDTILKLAERYKLVVIEDAAQAICATYKGRPLATLGTFGCYSFHDTKNLTMGEGGALLINNPVYQEQAEIIREKGTNRAQFYRGEKDKYTWVEVGSSFLPSELNAAYLWPQLERANEINAARMECWNAYYDLLSPLADRGILELPVVPKDCTHNAHMFYLKAGGGGLKERSELIEFLKEQEIYAVFHYVPLHSAPAGRRYGRFNGQDVYTTKESERLLRLPLYYGLSIAEVEQVAQKIFEFYGVTR